MKKGLLIIGAILGMVNLNFAQYPINYKQQAGPKAESMIETRIYKVTEESYAEANNYKDQRSFSDKADLEINIPGFDCCAITYNLSFPDYKHPLENKKLTCEEGFVCCE